MPYNKINDTVIILTACVNPNGMPFTTLQDNDIRISQYQQALTWYLENTLHKIVFVENTNCDFSNQFKDYIRNERLECITFMGNDFDKNLGKGYGEALIIKTALERSKFLMSCNRIIKITGRIIVKNISEILSHCIGDKTLYANTIMMNGRVNSQSVFFIAPIEYISDFFLPKIYFLNDSKGYYFEHLLYDTGITWHTTTGGNISDFIIPLKIDGISGSTGKPYSTNCSFQYIRALLKYYFHKKLIYRNHILRVIDNNLHLKS